MKNQAELSHEMVMKQPPHQSLGNEVGSRDISSQEMRGKSHQEMISHLFFTSSDRKVLYSCLGAATAIKHNTRMLWGWRKETPQDRKQWFWHQTNVYGEEKHRILQKHSPVLEHFEN